jgi:hypothetical protein
MAACAAFFKESRMKFVDPTKPYRKSGGMAPEDLLRFLPLHQSKNTQALRFDIHAPSLVPLIHYFSPAALAVAIRPSA